MMKAWTRKEKLDALMQLHWEVQVTRDDSDAYYVARIPGLPDVIATGADDRELARDLWESLEASLDARLDDESQIPLPRESQLPWSDGGRGALRRHSVAVHLAGESWLRIVSASAGPSLGIA